MYKKLLKTDKMKADDKIPIKMEAQLLGERDQAEDAQLDTNALAGKIHRPA